MRIGLCDLGSLWTSVLALQSCGSLFSACFGLASFMQHL